MHDAPESENTSSSDDSRRSFVGKACGVAMTGAMVASYGTLIAYAGRYLYPAKPTPKAWMFVALADDMKEGDSLAFKTPGGARVAIARQGSVGDVSDFIALSSTCPHLGCQVHWEGQNNRFFCPCHNGAFDPQGIATSGPPADAGQSLPRYPLKIEKGLLFIEVETVTLAQTDAPSVDASSNDSAGGVV